MLSMMIEWSYPQGKGASCVTPGFDARYSLEIYIWDRKLIEFSIITFECGNTYGGSPWVVAKAIRKMDAKAVAYWME